MRYWNGRQAAWFPTKFPVKQHGAMARLALHEPWRNAMMDDRNDPNRPLSYSQYDRSRLSDDRFSGWGLPALIGAIVLVGGLLLFGTGPTNKTTTAQNDRAPVTANAPTPTPVPMPPAGAQK
jgi:hypothetical protein